MPTLILLRHGQSEWNERNLFTGWIDVGLSQKGYKEARRAKELLKDFSFAYVFCSVLKRAIETAQIVTEGHEPKPEWFFDKALNERNYGELQGMNKDEARRMYGLKQVEEWRRGFFSKPPGGESLSDTCARVLPYYKEQIWPHLKSASGAVLISAHGNSLRGLVMELEHLSEEEIPKVEIPTGVPIVYEIDPLGQVTQKRMLEP